MRCRAPNPFEKPAKTVLLSEWSAESGAMTTLDSTLATLVDAWPDLPDAIRAAIVAMVKAALPAGACRSDV